MSGSKPTESPGEATPSPGGRTADAAPPRHLSMPVWWLASLVFHALLVGWLFFLSPVRVIDLTARPANPAPNVSSARAARVMEQIREQQAENLAGEVRALGEARRELAALEARKRDELRVAFTNAPVPIEKVAAAQAESARAQAAAESALKQAVARAASDLSGITSTAAIREAQVSVGNSQAEALEALALAEPKFEPAYQAQAEANAAQLRAAQAQAEAEGQFTGAAVLQARNAPAMEDLEEAKQMLHSFETQLAAALTNAATLSNGLPQMRAEATSAQSAYGAAQASGEKAQINRTRQSARDTQKAVENAQKNLARAQSDIAKFQSRIAEQTARIAKFSAKANPLEADPATMRQNAVEKLRDAQRLQTEAAAAQARAARSFADVQRDVAVVPTTATMPGDDLASVYQSAVQTEVELAEAYRRLRATELALQRQIPLGRALELTDAARPARPDLTASLSGLPGSGADATAQREAVLEARAQIAAMRSLADSMLAQARGLAGSTGNGQQRTLEALAVEDDNQRAKDLTGAMRGGSGTRGPGPGTGGSNGTRENAGAGSGRGGSGGDADGVTSGASGGGGSGWGSGDSDVARSVPPPVPKDLSAVPGRVIGAKAVPWRWMFVDSWYLLGPFDNAGRANLDKQFPPETVIDLNATYVGKRGRPVRWGFHQSPHPRVAPPFDDFNPLANGIGDGGAGAFKARDLEYIIYYGYTELRAEQDCDVWLAIGSDDFSKLWIEDQLVWASGKNHKSWRVDEGFRKVRLKQGVNRLLIRVENGHAQSEFSLAVCSG